MSKSTHRNLPKDSDAKPDALAREPLPGREQLLADAVADYVDRLAREETIDLEAFCLLHPNLEPDLRRELETLEEIDSELHPGPGHAEADSQSEELPERLSGHKILSQIGSGGMGRVFLAMDQGLKRKVAIKTLARRYSDNQQLRTRFMQEARAMARLNHPNIARIYNLGQPDEIPHFVMEYLEGTSLTEAARPLALNQRVELILKVVLAVDFLHQHQIIHRDLKPGNILVGPDLEPKVLDFGLALQVDDPIRTVSQTGEVLGTPQYFAPEQARHTPLDARSDVFTLGAIFYQLLTGKLPFRGESYAEQIQSICEQDPVLPRRIDPVIPGELQNICLKALEKKPQDRYSSAREMADDLERYLSGEPVLALPTSYARLMTGKIDQHLRELNGWKQDQILSEYEYDSFRKLYERLVEREDAWIMEVRRLSLPQVSLYLGAWLLVVAAALVVLFRYAGLSGTPAVLAISGAAGPCVFLGVRCWKRGQYRIAVAYLLAFCLLLPIAMVVAMGEWGLLKTIPEDRKEWELFSNLPGFKQTTNAQLWWSILMSLPVYYWLRRFTRASVFSLVLAVMAAALSLVTLLRMGMLEWLDKDPGKFYFHLIPFAFIFLVTGMLLERRQHQADSRYFYPIAVLFTLVALSGVAAFHEPYARWLNAVAPITRGRVEYLFVINAGIYFALQHLCESYSSPQMRWVAKSFRFVIPGHVLGSILLLGLHASSLWHGSPDNRSLRFEARLFEIALPAVACLFVLGSISKQMKNYLAVGLLFLAIGIVRLQRDLFEHQAAWPVSLLVIGLALMLAAANYSSVKISLSRILRRKQSHHGGTENTEKSA
jgi:serine/threonine-protein kinase